MSNQDDLLAECCRHLAHSQHIIEAKRAEIERLRLTDAEREAVEWCIFQQATPQRLAATLRGLLERLQ